MMESLEQLSSNNLEVVGIEINSVNCKVINTDRNKFEAIPKTIQPKELQDLTGLTVYDVNNFEHKILQQVTNEVVDKMVNICKAPMTLDLGINETANERKIRTEEMIPFGSTDISNEKCKSSEDILQKYLITQSKLSNTIEKLKPKTQSSKKEFKKNLENKKLNSIKKTESSNKESENEYFPSTESGSGKRKLTNNNKTYKHVNTKRNKKSLVQRKHKLCSNDNYTNNSNEDYFETKNISLNNVKPLDDGIEEDFQHRLREYEKCNIEIAIDSEIKELQDLIGLTVYDVNNFEHKILQQVASEGVDNKMVNVCEAPMTLDLGISETENEHKIRIGEMTPFGSTDISNEKCKSSEDILQKYLMSQSKLSSLIKNPKLKTTSLKKKFKKILESRKLNLINKTETSNKESESEYFPSTESSSDNETYKQVNIKRRKKSLVQRKHKLCSNDNYTNSSDDDYFETKTISLNNVKPLDDGIEEDFQHRLREYEKCNIEIATDNDDVFHCIDGDYFKIPKEIWEKLYKYQKIGVKWLWELHQQGSGGILGDEMGLGKTIQIIVFFGALYWSRLKDKITGIRGLGPSLIVCPATLIHQWVEEFHKWCPPIRVVVLHDTGTYKGKPADLIKEVWSNKGVLITTYNGLFLHSNNLLNINWHYTVLDEGHKIRNPDSKITIAAKQLKSKHRIIISGSPIQNHLKELWSLFDFIFPGKLGTLPAFLKSFAIPITQGGYKNATELQITTAYKCAIMLKDIINPYLLRRMKADVQSHISLPDKNEQVLFCRLTDEQKTLYKGFLEHSDIIPEIMNGNSKIFIGISRLRSICNHPDLFQANAKTGSFGYWKKSGKMIVVEALLKMWKKQNHRVLLFTQSVKMLNILQEFIIEQNYTYLKLEGSTSISSRQPIINKFNKDPSIFVMILTTKVGGLGINLIGANRVIIFDPDWNPATDLQARERAWRIGQTNPVTIYRLLTAGTIEEKMYHRQIYKQFLSNKILVDPKQRRFFKSNYLYELFTLQDVDEDGVIETTDIFAGTGSEINLKNMIKSRHKKNLSKKLTQSCSFSNSQIEAMKEKARELSKMVVKNSKTIINQQTTPTESDTNSEHCTKIDILLLPNTTDIQKNDYQFSILVNNETANKSNTINNSSTKELTTDNEPTNYFLKRKSSKDINTKNKKPKIPYLVKYDVYQEEYIDDHTSKKQDDYVLEKLFNKSGVKAVMRHDIIMESSNSDYVILENEAQKLAKKAIEELEASRNQCWEPGSGRLNWTGYQGTIRPKLFINKKIKDDESKEPSILSMMKKRNGFMGATQHEIQILNSIRQYLLKNNKSVNTDQIVNQFKNKYSADDTPLFKSLLTAICTFTRCSDKTGIWTLKSKYC